MYKVFSSIAHVSLHELICMYDQHTSTPVGLAASAKPKYVTPKVMFGYCCSYCGMRKLYYVLPPGYNDKSVNQLLGIITISNKSAGN